MVKNIHKRRTKRHHKQANSSKAYGPLGAQTPYDFRGQHLTAFGGLLPIATMLEKLGFRDLVVACVKTKRATRAMSLYQFVLAMVLGMYLGFPRFHQFRFVASDPMLKGVLHIEDLPAQCTFWRFLAGLHSSVAIRLVQLQQQLRARVWESANVKLRRVTLDTDTTSHTLYGKQMGGRISYAPKKKGAPVYQPILTFLAESREYVAGQLRNGDRPSAEQIQAHLRQVFACLPPWVKEIRARADSGFYCWLTVKTYLAHGCQFIMVARKTSRLMNALNNAVWRPSPKTDADGECDFLYQPEGWPQAFRFIALRFEKPRGQNATAAEQYQLFETRAYLYRVFVTNMEGSVYRLVEFYNGRCASENLIKEANNDAGMAVHPFYRFDMNQNHFQLAMLAYNLNCWLLLFLRPASVPVATLRHTTLATTRLRFLYIAARLWRHAGRVGISYCDSYPDKELLTQLLGRLRRIRCPDVSLVRGPAIATG